MSDATPEGLVEKATAKGKFNFADVLKGRGYPEDTATVWLDESVAYPLLELDIKIAEKKAKLSRLPLDEDNAQAAAAIDAEIEELQAKVTEVSDQLKESRFTFLLRGVDNGTAEDLLELALAEYPYEYDEYYNPITGARVREHKENQKRDRYYTNLLWQAHIISITDAEGNEDFMPSLETVAAARRVMPRAATAKIAETIDKVDMAVDWFAAVVDEGFLAKS